MSFFTQTILAIYHGSWQPIMKLKEKYNRVRPYRLDDTIKPTIDPPGHPAYPSGHATQMYFLSTLLSKIIETENASTVILSSSPDSKYLGAYLAGYTGGSYISNVVELPESINPFIVKRSCFTNKAFSSTELKGDLKIISILFIST